MRKQPPTNRIGDKRAKAATKRLAARIASVTKRTQPTTYSR